ncbi:MAG: class I SAM-dependent methyltransferase [bacterium]
MQIKKKQISKWWAEKDGFFGKHYLEADNSIKGFLFDREKTLKERTLTEVNGLISVLDLRGYEKILDIPCGYGRHSIELAKRGFSLVGSDLNSIHLRKAKRDVEKAEVKIKFVKEDMIKIRYDSEFDVLINMFFLLVFLSPIKKICRFLNFFLRL